MAIWRPFAPAMPINAAVAADSERPAIVANRSAVCDGRARAKHAAL